MLRHRGTVEIRTPRLLLRRLQPSDAGSIYANWGADPEVYRYMTSPIMPELDDVRAFLEKKQTQYLSRSFYYWGVTPADDPDEVIGMTTLTEISDFSRTANLAYTIGRPWWHRGLATEAAGAVMAFAFSEVGFRKLYGCHFTENVRSGRVLTALGMEHKGRGRTPVWQDGRYLTYENYELTAPAWARRKRGKA